jgi:hypothetical protein
MILQLIVEARTHGGKHQQAASSSEDENSARMMTLRRYEARTSNSSSGPTGINTIGSSSNPHFDAQPLGLRIQLWIKNLDRPSGFALLY